MFSQHAITRMQQRGISGEAVELLLNYGRSSYHKGAKWSISTAVRARRYYSPEH